MSAISQRYFTHREHCDCLEDSDVCCDASCPCRSIDLAYDDDVAAMLARYREARR